MVDQVVGLICPVAVMLALFLLLSQTFDGRKEDELVAAHQLVIFYPKFYRELNFIGWFWRERLWNKNLQSMYKLILRSDHW